MRRALRAVFRVLSAPFRGVRGAYQRLRHFLTYDPEEVAVSTSFATVIEHPQGVLEHIEALRRHLMRSLLALLMATLLSFAIARNLLEFLARPAGGLKALQAIGVTEPLGVFMRVSLLSGFALAFPYIALEFFAFVQSGLKPRARLLLLVAIPAATLLFVAGMAFTYYVMLPTALPFLLNFLGIATKPRVDDYVRFVTGIMFWIGVAFQFPLVIYVLAAAGLVRARGLYQQWRLAFVAIAVLAAAVTPTVDPVNMALVMAPMVVLYFLGIGLALIAQRGQPAAEASLGG